MKFSSGPEETIPPQPGTNPGCLLLKEDMKRAYSKIPSVRCVSKQTCEKLDSKTYYISREESDLKLPITRLPKTDEDEFEIEDSGKSIKKQIEDINTSQSSINTSASEWNEPDQDSDSDTYEHEPLLDKRHVNIKSNTEQHGFRIEEHRPLLHRQTHYTEGYSVHRRQDFIEETFVPGQQCRTEYENNSRPVCAHHISSQYQPPSHYNQNTVADSKQIYQSNVPSELYCGNNVHGYPFQNQNRYHVHPHALNNAPYICPRHGNQEHFHSPNLDKRYVHSMIEPYGERMYDGYGSKAYPSYPQDQYRVYENRQRQYTYRPSVEFQAVDPHAIQIDSGNKNEN